MLSSSCPLPVTITAHGTGQTGEVPSTVPRGTAPLRFQLDDAPAYYQNPKLLRFRPQAAGEVVM